MCNGNNHNSNCTCGFSGGSRPGRASPSSVPYVNRSDQISLHHDNSVGFRATHGSSMRQLSEDLGRPLTFPATCHYCDSPIYLYAHPNGGFAVFNELGQPWPKHVCRGQIPQHAAPNPPQAILVNLTLVHIRNARRRIPSHGEQIIGTVTSWKNGSNGEVMMEIFDGTCLVNLRSTLKIDVGDILRGVIRKETGQYWIGRIQIFALPKVDESKNMSDSIVNEFDQTTNKMLKCLNDIQSIDPTTSSGKSLLHSAIIARKYLTAMAISWSLLGEVDEKDGSRSYISCIGLILASLSVLKFPIAATYLLESICTDDQDPLLLRMDSESKNILQIGKMRRHELGESECAELCANWFSILRNRERSYFEGRKRKSTLPSESIDRIARILLPPNQSGG